MTQAGVPLGSRVPLVATQRSRAMQRNCLQAQHKLPQVSAGRRGAAAPLWSSQGTEVPGEGCQDGTPARHDTHPWQYT